MQKPCRSHTALTSTLFSALAAQQSCVLCILLCGIVWTHLKSTFQISSKWMTGPPPAQASIHWTINCDRCWRNVPVPGDTKISNHCRPWLWRWREKFPWPWFLNRLMTSPNVCDAMCKQKADILSDDHWNVFLSL